MVQKVKNTAVTTGTSNPEGLTIYLPEKFVGAGHGASALASFVDKYERAVTVKAPSRGNAEPSTDDQAPVDKSDPTVIGTTSPTPSTANIGNRNDAKSPSDSGTPHDPANSLPITPDPAANPIHTLSS